MWKCREGWYVQYSSLPHFFLESLAWFSISLSMWEKPRLMLLGQEDKLELELLIGVELIGQKVPLKSAQVHHSSSGQFDKDYK